MPRLIVALSVLVLAGCSMPDDVKDTRKNSEDLRVEASKLGANAEVLKEETTKMNKGIEDVKHYGRKGTVDHDITYFFKLLEQSGSNTERCMRATQLIRTLEFQQWSGNGDDNVARKEDLDERGMEQFMGFAKSLISGNYDVGDKQGLYLSREWRDRLSMVNPPDSRWLNVAALAANMHEVDVDQVAAAARLKIPISTIYSMIINGLSLKEAHDRGEKVPKYVETVLRFEPEAKFLLQMRHNFFPVMVLSEFTDIDKEIFNRNNLMNFPLDLFDRINSVMRTGFKAKLTESNLTRIKKEAVDWGRNALDTQKDLEKLGIKLEFNPFAAQVFYNSEFIIDEASLKESTQLVLFKEEVTQLKNVYSANGYGKKPVLKSLGDYLWKKFEDVRGQNY